MTGTSAHWSTSSTPEPTPLWCFRERGDQPGSTTDVSDQERDADSGGRALACAACRHPITTEADRIEIDGRHEHDAVNPHGYGFHFGCFDRAPGTVQRGEQTGHWSWFSGYRWQLSYCRGCQAHLGWMFMTNTHRFHGLILDRLVETDEDDA